MNKEMRMFVSWAMFKSENYVEELWNLWVKKKTEQESFEKEVYSHEVIIKQSEIIDTCVLQVANYKNLSVDDIYKLTRKRDIVVPRQLAITLSCKYCLLKLESVGMYFSGKTHGTVIHARKSVNNLIQTDKQFRKDYIEIERSVKLMLIEKGLDKFSKIKTLTNNLV